MKICDGSASIGTKDLIALDRLARIPKVNGALFIWARCINCAKPV